MTSFTIQISETARDILRRSTVTSDRLKLPPEVLPREDYDAVNNALTKLGGKWNRSAKAHIFTSDPREAIKALVGGEKVIDEKKQLQAFFTPDETAKRLVQAAAGLFDEGIIPHKARILEPSVGGGSLVRALKGEAPSITDITAYDVNEKLVLEQRRLGINAEVADFLTVQPPVKKFNVIIMNPPFTKKQDAKHVLHAWKFLGRGGILVAIVSPAYRYRSEQVYKDLRAMIDSGPNNFEEDLPEGTFGESGTNVKTVMIGCRKVSA